MVTTRLLLIGIGGQRVGSFVGKSPRGGSHPFSGGTTRLGLIGIPREPYGGFSAKGVATPTGDGLQLARRRRRMPPLRRTINIQMRTPRRPRRR